MSELLDVVAREILDSRENPGACWHNGRISNKNWLPYFSCKAVGDALLAGMENKPGQADDRALGHTHSSGIYSPQPNIVVRTGAAEYGVPQVPELIAWGFEDCDWTAPGNQGGAVHF
jgi:hypothetical protein